MNRKVSATVKAKEPKVSNYLIPRSEQKKRSCINLSLLLRLKLSPFQQTQLPDFIYC